MSSKPPSQPADQRPGHFRSCRSMPMPMEICAREEGLANRPALDSGGCRDGRPACCPMAGQAPAPGEVSQEGDEPRVSRSLVVYARGGRALFVYHTRDHRDIPRDVLQLEFRAGDLSWFIPRARWREDVRGL